PIHIPTQPYAGRLAIPTTGEITISGRHAQIMLTFAPKPPPNIMFARSQADATCSAICANTATVIGGRNIRTQARHAPWTIGPELRGVDKSNSTTPERFASAKNWHACDNTQR